MDVWAQATKMVWSNYWWAILLVLAVLIVNLIDNALQARARRKSQFTRKELKAARIAQAKARYRLEVKNIK